MENENYQAYREDLRDKPRERLIQNAVYCKDTDTYYNSVRCHDWVGFESGGQNCFIDGGLEYVRSTVHPDTVVDMCLYDSDDLETIKEKYLWGTYGINGDQPLKWVVMSQCSDDHLLNIAKNLPLSGWPLRVLLLICNDRGLYPEMYKCEVKKA